MSQVITALLVGILALEARAWTPRIIDSLIQIAAKRLPRQQRARYLEEWRAHIEDTPGVVKRFWDALGFFIASAKMFPHFIARVRRVQRHRRSAAMSTLMRRVTLALLDTNEDRLRVELSKSGYPSASAPKVYTLVRIALVVAIPALIIVAFLLKIWALEFFPIYILASVGSLFGLYGPKIFLLVRKRRLTSQ